MRRPAFITASLITTLVACSETKPHEADPPIGRDACRGLVAAPPAKWSELWPTVRAFGPEVVPSLLDAIERDPLGDGTQAGIHLLGEFGGEAARTFLEAELSRGSSLAQEAALALGQIGSEASVKPLHKVLADRTTPVTTRAAAAAALVDLGEAKSILPFLRAVFLAAGPYRGSTSKDEGLPRNKVRWALERYMIIEAFRRRYDESTFGLEEDASWPALRDGVAKLSAFLEKTN